MSDRLHVPREPCPTCPYRRDTPPGVWATEEYRKLPEYDPQPDGPGALATFHCHQERASGVPTVCRGWLAVHGFDSVAVRLAVARGLVSAEAVEQPVRAPLYDSGALACAAGLAGVERPGPEAVEAIGKLTLARARRNREERP